MKGLFSSLVTVGIDSIKQASAKAAETTIDTIENIKTKAENIDEQKEEEARYLQYALVEEYNLSDSSWAVNLQLYNSLKLNTLNNVTEIINSDINKPFMSNDIHINEVKHFIKKTLAIKS